MKHLALGKVKVRDLKLPGNWKLRKAAPSVPQMAKSQDVVGILQPPLVRKRDRLLICGGDRVAGAQQRGVDEIEVLWVDCSDEEIPAVRAIENVRRRAATNEEREVAIIAMRQVELDELPDIVQKLPPAVEQAPVEQQEAADASGKPSAAKRRPGRPPSKETEKTRAVAERLGVSDRTVRRDLERLAEKAAAPAEAPPPIDLQGQTMPERAESAVRRMVEAIDECDKVLRSFGARLTKLATELLEGPTAFQERVQEVTEFRHAATDLGRRLRARKPQQLCPYCKLWVQHCPSCRGTGYATAEQMASVPPELLETGEKAGVYVDGQFVLLSTLRGRL